MFKIKRYFSAETSECSYNKELKRLAVIVISTVFISLSDSFIINNNLYKDINVLLLFLIRVSFVFIYIVAILLLIISLARLINISDNKEKKLIKKSEKKYKYKPLKYRLDDVIFVFKYYDIPNTIYIKDQMNQVHALGLSMDYDEGRQLFFDRQYTINNKLFDEITKFKKFILDNSFCDDFENVLIISLIDNNNPKLFRRVISKCRKKNKE